MEGKEGEWRRCECASAERVHEVTQWGVKEVSERRGSPTAGEQGDR